MMKGRSLVVQKSKEPMSKPKKFFMQPFTRKCCSSNLPDDISRLTEVKQTYFKVKESEETLPGFDDIITMKDKESNSLAPKTKVEFEGFVMELAKLDKLVFQSLVQRNKDSKG
ncbi:hypothetical protein CAPTEDRAFT_185675 [Capitella teleta]|nr:hypothetical protein CAPTEDRAFT_185675 [Capitella teleta]|eukprot:ELT93976.1 hypothetical protein CAPTEDRAFT_185675 [Capitella teleta]